MNVDFNNLRKQTAYSLDSLTNKLNDAILKTTQYAVPNGTYHKQEMDIKGYILIDAEDIQKTIDNLRSQVACICYTYRKDDDDFKDVMEEVEENGGLAWFNNEEIED
jgi:hypothetical protein